MSTPRAAAAVALLLASSGCTSFADTLAAGGPPQAASAPSSPGRPPGTEGASCPAERAAPDPARPVISYDFRLSDDRATVTGTETVAFTPDRATDQLVFRLVPNGPESAEAGSRLVVDDVRGADVAGTEYRDADAEPPGGLYVVQLRDDVAAGETTSVELDFTLTLGQGGFDRFGRVPEVSWWASGAPLLAWEPGVGWAEDPFVDLPGETTTSPAADTTVRVSAPEELTVLMTGAQEPPLPAPGNRRIWTSSEPAARDVSVAAGEFTTAETTTPDGVRITTGVLPDAALEATELAERTSDAVRELAERLGPFPYRTLTVPLLPDYGGGIEYPSSILQATPSQAVLEHEVAHMWFYGMVGNSQFRDPWLDEAFATYAEAVLDPPRREAVEEILGEDGDVGASMAELEPAGADAYFDVVYGKGGAALLAARDEAGAAAFDAALRCYVRSTAWRIASPRDVAAAFADVPGVLEILVGAGALDDADLPR